MIEHLRPENERAIKDYVHYGKLCRKNTICGIFKILIPKKSPNKSIRKFYSKICHILSFDKACQVTILLKPRQKIVLGNITSSVWYKSCKLNIITFILFRYSTRITCTRGSMTLTLTSIWESIGASKNISPPYVWSILRGCKTQWPRIPGIMTTTQNICKVSENIYISPNEVLSVGETARTMHQNWIRPTITLNLNLMSQSFKSTLIHTHCNSTRRIHRTLKIYACSHYHHIFRLESFWKLN